MTARGETGLWLAQRIAGLVLAFAVVIHLATIILAVRQGLTAVAILERTRGNLAWLHFYLAFALAAAIHGGIGLRTIVREATRWRGLTLDLATGAVVILLTFAGWRAATALFE